jgi:hypothetical protein
MINISSLVKRVLKESDRIISDEGSISQLIIFIENQEDPDPEELYLLESLYQYHEKASLLQSHINKFIQKSNQSLKGNKLDNLYENSNKYGTSKLFD